MSTKALIRTFLLSKTTISDLIGQRMYSPPAPSSTSMPYATMFVLNDKPLHHLSGRSGSDTLRMQLDCWGTNLDDAWALSKVIEEAMDTHTGDMTHDQITQRVVCLLQNKREDLAKPAPGSESTEARIIQEWLITTK